MEWHGKGPFIQHYNGEISYTDNMERERNWNFSWLGRSFKNNGCHKTYTMSGGYMICKQCLVIIKNNGRQADMTTILVYLLDKHRFTRNLDSIVKFYYSMIDQDCVAILVMFYIRHVFLWIWIIPPFHIHRDHDRIIVGFTATYAISTYHY